MQTDQALLTRLAEDPREGIAEVMEQYTGLVWSVAAKYLDNPEDIKECVNDTFTEFYGKRAAFDPEKGTLKQYLAGIARHRAVDRYRAGQRQLKTGPLSEALGEETQLGSVEDRAALSAALDSVQEGDPVGLLLVENGGETAYDNCWFGGSTSGFLRALQALTWSRVPAPADPESENTVTLYAPNDWSLTAYADSDPVVRFQGPTGTWWLTGSGADPRQTPYQLLRDWGSSLWFNWAQAYTEARGEYLLSCFGLQAGDFSFAWDFNVSTYVGMDVYTWMADTMDLPSGATSPAYFVAPDLSAIYCVYQDPDAVNHLYCFVPEQEGAIQEYGGYTWMLQEVRTMQDTDRYVNTHQSMAEFMASWAPTERESPPR